MINNKRQHTIAKNELKEFDETINTLQNQLKTAGENAFSIEMNINSIKRFRSKLYSEIQEFEKLIAGRKQTLEFNSVRDIGRCLISTRIAMKISQKELAERLGIHEQQIQRYEQQEYGKANLERIMQICDELGIEVRLTKALEIKDIKVISESVSTKQSKRNTKAKIKEYSIA